MQKMKPAKPADSKLPTKRINAVIVALVIFYDFHLKKIMGLNRDEYKNKQDMLHLAFLIFLIAILSSIVLAVPAIQVDQAEFIEQMQQKYDFDAKALTQILRQATVSESVLAAISRPAEKKLVWHEYRNIFVEPKRIQRGIEFITQYEDAFNRAEQKFGVPREIIAAIIGVETFYGRIVGNYRVIDALYTLAFHYPERAGFFRGELEQFLLLVREQVFDPLTLKGSYAGAMGMPQFISSSYRNYAIDFDNDDVIDIWNNPIDAIGSVANYFVAHHWQPGQSIIEKITVSGDAYQSALTPDLLPDLKSNQLTTLGITVSKKYLPDEKLKLLAFEQPKSKEYWLARHNFYVITRYNHSALYAMAVYQLAQEIRQRLTKRN